MANGTLNIKFKCSNPFLNNPMEEIKERLQQFWDLPVSIKAMYYLLFLTFGNTIFQYIRPINNAAGVSESTDFIFTILWIIGIYFSLSLVFKSLRLIDIVFYFALCSFYYLSPTIYPRTRFFVENTFSIFALQTLPYYFLALMIDFNRDKTALIIISKLQIIMTAFFVLLSLLRLINTDVTGEQMDRSYSILFPTMFLYYTYSKSKQNKDLYFFLLGLSLILMFGTRGPLLCLIIYLFAFLILNNTYNAVMTINLLLGMIAVYIFLRPIMLLLMFLTRLVGLSTRIFESFLEDELFNYEKSSGRDEIHELLWNRIINDGGGIGYGLGSDRLLGRNGTEYAHNFVYEVWMDFGLYIGTFLLALFAFFIGVVFKKAFGSDRFNLFLILLVWSVGHLMISGSYLHDFQVYFFIGYCVNILRSDNQEESEDNVIICISEDN
jgi:hypothetical protein